jgi:hypothetical protein
MSERKVAPAQPGTLTPAPGGAAGGQGGMEPAIAPALWRFRYCHRVDPASDDDVSAAFTEGRPEGLSLAYERFGPLVYTLALRSVDDAAEAEDITQQVFVAAWRGRGGFDPHRGTLGGWLVAITRNKIADALRGRQRDQRLLRQIASGGATAVSDAPLDLLVDRSCWPTSWRSCPNRSGWRWCWPSTRA